MTRSDVIEMFLKTMTKGKKAIQIKGERRGEGGERKIGKRSIGGGKRGMVEAIVVVAVVVMVVVVSGSMLFWVSLPHRLLYVCWQALAL